MKVSKVTRNGLARLRDMFQRTYNHIMDRAITIQDNPIFIVGCGHSGTTLLATLLGSHHGIHLVNWETYIFRPNRTYRDIKSFFTDISYQADGNRVLEKTPRHVRDIDRIFRIFPDARILAMVRDGRDVACSMRKREILLTKGIGRWIQDCTYIERFETDPRVLVVKYEDLVTDPLNMVNRIMQFIGVDGNGEEILSGSPNIHWNFSWARDIDEASPEEYSIRSRHLERRNQQVNLPIYNDAGKWRRELSPKEAESITRTAERLLKKWNYA